MSTCPSKGLHWGRGSEASRASRRLRVFGQSQTVGKEEARVRRACWASRSWRSWPLGPRSLGHSLGARLPLLPDSPMGPELRAGRPPNQPLLCICRLGGSSPAYTMESGCRVPVPARPAWPPPAPVHLPGPQLFFQVKGLSVQPVGGARGPRPASFQKALPRPLQ